MCGNFFRVFFLSLFLVTAVLLAGCGAKEAVKSERGACFAVIQDDMGREVTLSKKPERIVVLSASFLEPLHAVGGDVVGRPDSKTKMPDFAKDKASSATRARTKSLSRRWRQTRFRPSTST